MWHRYLKDRREQVTHRRPEDPAVENLNRTYERALVYMHKMPRIWLEYVDALAKTGAVTEVEQPAMMRAAVAAVGAAGAAEGLVEGQTGAVTEVALHFVCHVRRP